MGLSQKECDLVKQIASMHDIGKVATLDGLRLKPGRLNDNEMIIIKDHASTG